MAVIKKKHFIPQCLEILRKELEEKLPDECFEFEMIEKADSIIYEKIRHLRMVL